ncbi:hypothetical protein TREES_T100017729 [Tupaia chinensis]|uniref:Uncharacterized protein n=1 Tax=Tupaia chinensis TaxID=246437 RepID=L9KXF3_TUPCH|nr:hypothetical protein TREES_T100017729 [Tupaia chinensis]
MDEITVNINFDHMPSFGNAWKLLRFISSARLSAHRQTEAMESPTLHIPAIALLPLFPVISELKSHEEHSLPMLPCSQRGWSLQGTFDPSEEVKTAKRVSLNEAGSVKKLRYSLQGTFDPSEEVKTAKRVSLNEAGSVKKLRYSLQKLYSTDILLQQEQDPRMVPSGFTEVSHKVSVPHGLTSDE